MRKGLLILMLLGGCAAQYTWDKPGSTLAQAQADSAQCYNEAERMHSDFGIETRIFGDARDVDWQATQRTQMEYRRSEFRQSCMLAKGYTMRRVASGESK